MEATRRIRSRRARARALASLADWLPALALAAIIIAPAIGAALAYL